MVNLLGLPNENSISVDKRLKNLERCEWLNLHWYGKERETPGRKLGHVTVLLEGRDSHSREIEAKKFLKRIRSIWPLYRTNDD